MDDRIKQLIEYEIAQDEDMNYFEKGIALNLLELAIAKGDDYCIGLDNYKIREIAKKIADNDELRDTLDSYLHKELEEHFEEYSSNLIQDNEEEEVL